MGRERAGERGWNERESGRERAGERESREASAIVLRDLKSRILADTIFGTHENVDVCAVEY